ncbi:hypothetical protein DPMN_142398 [Dreissena polymorpha]|uniref:VWFA domain-containing protein n=1 Tax=Dreissena polymorpha TaxID=45954 RepID=A0A9D4GB81_DREPO|nr:hypothetical protein DPMN_142398 [Dreissena polymorpha]
MRQVQTKDRQPHTQPILYDSILGISRCEAVPADVVFVLDSSLSQTEEQFNKQLDFVARFVNAVNVSDTEFQFSVVTFSTNAVIELEFDSLSKDAIKASLFCELTINRFYNLMIEM